MAPDKTAYLARLPGGYVVIENVPCMRCAQCGEAVFSASVMERIDEILEKVQRIAGKLLIMDYAQAA